MSEQKPSIGRVVHYWILNPEECQETPNAAIITRVLSSGNVDLQIFGDVPPPRDNAHMPSRPDLRFNVGRAEVPQSGTWSWPPRT